MIAVLGSRDVRADFCADATAIRGLRACDKVDTTGSCPSFLPEHGPALGSWETDFSTRLETEWYLYGLATDVDDPADPYMARIELGWTWMMGLAIDAAYGTPASDPDQRRMLAVRVTAHADDAEERKPAILFTCGVHAHEWLPQETCLGLVDYFVKAANEHAPYGDPAEGQRVRDLLAERELWFIVNANPSGRDYDDEGTEDGWGFDHNQRKNMQWSTSLDCAQDSYEQDGAGASGDDVYWPGDPKVGRWNATGVNLDVAFSSSWGDGSDYLFGRDMIAKTPDLDFAFAPPQFDCDNLDANCTDKFGADTVYSHCLPYYRQGETDLRYGCFPAGDYPDFNTCNNALLNSPPVATIPGELVPSTLSCLRTRSFRDPTTHVYSYSYYLWECGNSGAGAVAGVNEWDVADAAGNPLPSADPGNPSLLQYCHRGILQSCVTDADCRPSTSAVEPADFDVVINTSDQAPHFMDAALMDTQLYCAAGGGRYQHYNRCAVDGRRTCGSSTFGGRRPFEAVEARLVRDLVNNVPFSLFVDMHAPTGNLVHICTSRDAAGNCDAADPEVENGTLLVAEAAAVYANGADKVVGPAATLYDFGAADQWDVLYGGAEAFPGNLELAANGSGSAASGLPPAWTAARVGAQGRDAATGTVTSPSVWAATRDNFDRGTVRAIPSLQWELGFDPARTNPNDPLYQRLIGCGTKPNGGGSRPAAALTIANHLAGARAMVTYLAWQAGIPNAARDVNGANLAELLPAPKWRHDVGLLGLRVHDLSGRGVQRSEGRWDRVDADPTAQIVIPAGTWLVSFDVVAAGVDLDVVDAELSLTVEREQNLPPGAPVVPDVDALMDKVTVLGVPTGKRWTETRGFEFAAGETYIVRAWNSNTSAGSNDSPSNDELVSRVTVRACDDEAAIPNGFDPDAFCQAGLPFADDRFECDPDRGTCRECWLEPYVQQDCEEGEFCFEGMCDDPETCWSGAMTDEREGENGEESPLTLHGSDLPVTRTLHRAGPLGGAIQDTDTFNLRSDSESDLPPTKYYLHVSVRNLCEDDVGLGAWGVKVLPGPMEELEVRVQVLSALAAIPFDDGDYVNLTNPTGDGWTTIDRLGGLDVELSVAETVSVLDAERMRLQVRNTAPALESIPYVVEAELDDNGESLAPLDPDVKVWPWDEVVTPTDDLAIGVSPGEVRSFVPTEDGVLDGYSVFFAPAAGYEELVDAVAFSLVTPDGSAPLDEDGAPLAPTLARDGGLAIPLADLEPRGGPYQARLATSRARVEGRVFLCGPNVPDCGAHRPRTEACGLLCAGGGARCCQDAERNLYCADVRGSDPTNCGACGATCDWDEKCLKGACVKGAATSCWNTDCPDGTECVSKSWPWLVNPECRATLVDRSWCGWFGDVCEDDETCAWGLCLPRWGEECNLACGEGESCCWVLGEATCVDVTSSEWNCGGCGNACDPGMLCADGTCAAWYHVIGPCGVGSANCGTGEEIACSSLATDEEHCGACSLRCGVGTECTQGVCVDSILHTPADGTEP